LIYATCGSHFVRFPHEAQAPASRTGETGCQTRERPECSETFFISSLKTDILKLEMCIFRQEIYISRLEIQNLSRKPAFPPAPENNPGYQKHKEKGRKNNKSRLPPEQNAQIITF